MSVSKILYPFLIMSLLLFLLSGCGSSTDTDKEETVQESTSQEEQVTDTDEGETDQEDTSQGEQATNIPHVLDGHDDCLGCHNTSTTLPVPADHQGRTNTECTDCHKVVSNPTATTALAIPHTLEGRDDCLMCHAEGTAMGVPASHAGRTVDVCTACHQPE